MVKYTSDVTLYRAGEGKKNQMIKIKQETIRKKKQNKIKRKI